MPIFTSNSASNCKVLLISTGVLYMALVLKRSVPLILEFSVTSWLRPPYLYILINGIIIGIVASSKIHPTSDESPPLQIVSRPPPPTNVSTNYTPSKIEDVMTEALPFVAEKNTATINGGDFLRNDSMEFLSNKEKEKPPVSARFANRKALKSSPQASKPKREETLESTWRTVTEGRTMPLKKSETLESHARPSPDHKDPKAMRKSETFHERNNGSRKLKREASLSQDELNRRVEAFIQKFNQEMRLQRQESLMG